MPTATVTIEVSTSGSVLARQIWASLATSDSAIVPVELDANGKRVLTLTKGRLYLIFWQLFGSPGGALGLKVTAQGAAKPLLEVKKSSIPSGRSYQAGVREFTP